MVINYKFSFLTDAFEIAEEIAEINDLNLQDIISSLVNKWLPSAESVDDGDSVSTLSAIS